MVAHLRPDVLLLDYDLVRTLSGGAGALSAWLETVHERAPHMGVIVLANNLGELKNSRAAGVEAAFLKGMLDDTNLRKALQARSSRDRPVTRNPDPPGG